MVSPRNRSDSKSKLNIDNNNNNNKSNSSRKVSVAIILSNSQQTAKELLIKARPYLHETKLLIDKVYLLYYIFI